MISVTIPFLPPSVNHAYFTRGHIRVLTTVGKAFKAQVKNHLGRNHPEFLAFFQKDVEYEILYVLFFPIGAVYTKTWKAQGSTVARHKKCDASNRIKLIEDVIAETAGYDDAQHISVSVVKVETPLDGHVDVYVWREDEDGPITRFMATRTAACAK